MTKNKSSNDEKILYILRGLPGSGKSSLAKTIMNSHGKRGVVLSADDYFLVNGKYEYDPSKIGEAHLFNQESCREKCEKGVSPVIIDNTNVKCWEAKVYVEIALHYGYKIEVREPETPWWKNRDPEKLARKTLHGVPLKKIKGMLDRWDDDFSRNNER
ncbi:P-loop containing nucleoside triphosphate hydrolase protein [Neocallimastix lanati (nom. inval.)]|nr:P-loop containing nucleoside triphosphate hydrolase protein [Neocallimastix sp. JGI-2020a]